MISISIWRKTLVAHDACEEGLRLFDTIAKMQPESDARRLDRIRVPRWTPLHSVWGYAVCGQFAIWLEKKGIIPRAYLSRANLSGANLSFANLSRANLYGADLSGAYRGSSPTIPGWRTLATGYLEKET